MTRLKRPDNYTITSGGASRTVRAKEIGGILHRMSISTDVTGAPIATGNGLYVRQDGAWTFGLTGALPLSTGASTETTLAALSAKLPSTIGHKAAAASLGVVLASDQALPLPAGASTFAAQPRATRASPRSTRRRQRSSTVLSPLTRSCGPRPSTEAARSQPPTRP